MPMASITLWARLFFGHVTASCSALVSADKIREAWIPFGVFPFHAKGVTPKKRSAG